MHTLAKLFQKTVLVEFQYVFLRKEWNEKRERSCGKRWTLPMVEQKNHRQQLQSLKKSMTTVSSNTFNGDRWKCMLQELKSTSVPSSLKRLSMLIVTGAIYNEMSSCLKKQMTKEQDNNAYSFINASSNSSLTSCLPKISRRILTCTRLFALSIGCLEDQFRTTTRIESNTNELTTTHTI